MPLNITWSNRASKQYIVWKRTNPSIQDKIDKLIDDIENHPFEGLCKPEPLKYKLQSYWSRRITEEHRLIYKVNGNMLYILLCHEHYYF